VRRLVLFDIDGTLLTSGPLARQAFAGALRDVFGTEGDMDTFRFEGKLDPVIVTELMSGAGVDAALIQARRDEALGLYLDRLEAALEVKEPTLKPGVRALVERVAAAADVLNAVLTGNVARGAKIKLSAARLFHHFKFGVYGDERPRRVDLGPVAVERAHALTGVLFLGSQCVVVGDSTHDVACGQAIGARVVGVATGTTPRAALEAAGADIVFDDFSDVDAAYEAILA